MGLRDESRKAYSMRGSRASTDELTVGCLQRIADSLERMEKPYLDLLRKVEHYREEADFWRRQHHQETERLSYRIAGLRAAITKMKKRRDDGQEEKS